MPWTLQQVQASIGNDLSLIDAYQIGSVATLDQDSGEVIPYSNVGMWFPNEEYKFVQSGPIQANQTATRVILQAQSVGNPSVAGVPLGVIVEKGAQVTDAAGSVWIVKSADLVAAGTQWNCEVFAKVS